MKAALDEVPVTADSVRHYFARLSLHGKTRAVLAEWPRLSMDSYFAAMRLPLVTVNVERRPCATTPVSLGQMFSNVAWK